MLSSRFADKNCNRPQLAGLAAQYPRHSQYQIICREASWLHVARSGSVCVCICTRVVPNPPINLLHPTSPAVSGHSTRSSLNIENKQIFIYDQRYINKQNRTGIKLFCTLTIKSNTSNKDWARYWHSIWSFNKSLLILWSCSTFVVIFTVTMIRLLSVSNVNQARPDRAEWAP